MTSGYDEISQTGTDEVSTTGTPQQTRPWARALALTVYAVALLLWSRAFGIPSDTVQVFGWLWLATIAWQIEAPARQHLGFLRDWWIPLVGLVFYFYSRGLADELGFAPHIQMPIDVDLWLGAGTLPTERLQDVLCGDPCSASSDPRWFDLLFTSVYTSHFVVGLTLAVVLWLRNRREWMMWMRRYLAINFGALVIYILYPMAPPWMAARDGYISGDLPRLTGRGWSDVGLERFHLVLQGVGNPVAAMPSLHAGIAFLIAFYAVQRLRSPARWLLLGYPLVMSLALVYYAEHYVIDIVAGAALALVTLAGCSRWESSRDT
ncbi:phosphatase PAP2 family protein [Nocardioides pacificus]